MKNCAEVPEACGLTRRQFLKLLAAGAVSASAGLTLSSCLRREQPAETFIASAPDYAADLKDLLLRGFRELRIAPSEIASKRVLLKPNLVEPHRELPHINTHPLLIRAAVEAFRALGAAEVVVAEGAGHIRDAHLLLEESGLADVLYQDRIPFKDLNTGSVLQLRNLGKASNLDELFIPIEVARADILVSLAKMKTHHWAGVTLSMKNLFGIMPGIVYGWPKNVLHWAGIPACVYDINATVKPHLAIVDGIVGMEGDGPIMGTPIHSNVVVVGRNLPAVDATCCRIMGINPEKIGYLKQSSCHLGAIRERNITQRGESIVSVQKKFQLLEHIPAHRDIDL